MFLSYSNIKASGITFFFSLIGILSCYSILDWQKSLPLAIFYITLLINTFFSVQLFSSIIPPKHFIQNLIDCVLAVLYILVSLSMNTPFLFVFFLLFMFIFATMKYTLLLGVIHHPLLLKKKIFVDLLGVLACTLALAGIFGGYTIATIWILTTAFVLVNIVLFSIWPLYRLDTK